jgi:outer membrane protein assembly factor BamB
MKPLLWILACLLGGALTGLSQDTNRVIWQFPTGKYVFSSPALDDDGTIYLGSGNGRMYALRPNGNLKWSFLTGAEIQSSPAIGKDGTIYFGSGDGKVYALTPEGAKKWEFPTGDLILCSPTLGADGTIYIGSRDRNFYALDQDGEEKWRFATGQYYNDMPAVIGPEGTILISAAGTICAFKHNGELRWQRPLGFSFAGAAMAIGRGGVIYAAMLENGPGPTRLFALSHRGEILWRFTCGQAMAVSNPSFPAIGRDGTIYLGTPDGFLYAIRPDGTQKWKAPAARLQSAALLSDDGRIYLNSSWDIRMLSYDLDGNLKWEHALGAGPGSASGLISSFPLLKAGVLYVGSGNGSVFALRVEGEMEQGAWPAFGRDLQHTGRDLQRGIESLLDPETGLPQLRLNIEIGRPYVVEGSSNLKDWQEWTNLVSTTTPVTLPRIGNHLYYRLKTSDEVNAR